MFLTAGLVALIFILLIVFAAIKKKPNEVNQPSVIQQFMQPQPAPVQSLEPAPVRFVSMRDQQLAEDAAMVASEYQRMQEDMKRASIREGLEVAAAYSKMREAKRQEELQALFAK